MKKFTKILVCFMLCVCGLLMVACGDPRTKEEKAFTYPSVDDVTYGNGGLAVRKGDYLYFVNGYRSVSSLSSKEETVEVGSLMLTKLDKNGNIVKNDEGLLRDDYYITMNDKLCGYQVTNLFIHGDYLYFVSPCLENESGKNGPWAKERVVFNRIKLDKSSDVEEIYSSGVKYDNLEYQYYQQNGSLYVLAWEKGDSHYENYGKDSLIRVDVANKSSKVVANNVKDVVFAESGSQVFFMQNAEGENNFYLKKYNVGADSLKTYNTYSKTFDLLAVTDEEVFISIEHDYSVPEKSTEIMSSNIENNGGFVQRYAYIGTKEINITTDGQIVLVEGNKFTFIGNNTKKEVPDESASSINIIGYTNGCVLYYDEVSNIKLVSYSNAIAGSEVEISTLTTISAVEEDVAYFDLNEEENCLYFYKKSGNNFYLYRIKVNNNYDSKEEMIGVYQDGDIPVVEEEEEEIEE